MLWFIKKALQDQVSGIDLKDESGSAEALSEGLLLVMQIENPMSVVEAPGLRARRIAMLQGSLGMKLTDPADDAQIWERYRLGGAVEHCSLVRCFTEFLK